MEVHLQRLTEIPEHVKREKAKGDFESAASAERELMRECLGLILRGHHDPKRVAQLGLSTQKFRFPR